MEGTSIAVEYLDEDEIVDYLGEKIGFSDETVERAKELYNELDKKSLTKDSVMRSAIAIRIAGCENGEPVRYRIISGWANRKTNDLINLNRDVTKALGERHRAEPEGYIDFLCKRIGATDEQRKRAVEIYNKIVENEMFQGTAMTNLGCYSVAGALYEDDDSEGVQKIVSTALVSKATLRKHISQMDFVDAEIQ